MGTEQQRRMRELFDAALDQPVETRQQFLADACNGDQKLFETVQRLLSANQRGAGVLDTPVFRRLELEPTANEPGSFIGPYKILRELGGGGMGIVYQVVRADEVFQRVFALKLIRPELSSDWLLERFRQERRILGRLDHLNIARIVDGGSTTEGLPYFVMDFVDGPSISHFCTQHALSIRPRVVLFQQVCAAVQYLHGNGVIHGDLKPPNILIGIDGAAKLVDFGIASVLASPEQEEQNKTLPLMTPGYASPEQMRGQPLSPLSDVYSLGVILYELMAGVLPFPAASRSRSDILKAVTTQKPVPPSAHIDANSLQGQLSAELKGDLDSIVLRAMHCDPAHRYTSVANLASDLAGYLQDRPVAARAGGVVYRGRKFLRRNTRSVLASCVIVALLGTTSWEGLQLHKRIERSQQLEEQLRTLQARGKMALEQRKAEFQVGQGRGVSAAADPKFASQIRESQLRDVHNLAEAYRTTFSESVRIWPGMTASRRELLDNAAHYLREAEPFVAQDSRAPEQLASAWLWLANLEGNPQAVNLHDEAAATASIHEAKRILQKSPAAASGLAHQVEAAAKEIQGGH